MVRACSTSTRLGCVHARYQDDGFAAQLVLPRGALGAIYAPKLADLSRCTECVCAGCYAVTVVQALIQERAH